MINSVSTKECYICGACANICPEKAISFSLDSGGLAYPEIDMGRCIECGLCEDVCPILTPRKYMCGDGYPAAFAARSKDIDTRLNSTSGAVFFEAGAYIISSGGYVSGAVFDNGFKVRHILSNSMEDLQRMRGSKYAQSDTVGVYADIKLLLEKETCVLFCGCPCQVAALKNYLGRDYKNLYLVDFICHGISGQGMLDEYIAELEKRKKSKVIRFRFRDKCKGWHSSSVIAEFENGRRYSNPMIIDPYLKASLSGATVKEGCYSCQFKGFVSGSDLTLGDLWGAEVLLPDWDDNTGISAAIVNTEKGGYLLERIGVQKREMELDQIIRYNSSAVHPTDKNDIREEFFAYARLHGNGKAIMHYFEESRVEKLARNIRYSARCVYYKMRGRGKPLY